MKPSKVVHLVLTTLDHGGPFGASREALGIRVHSGHWWAWAHALSREDEATMVGLLMVDVAQRGYAFSVEYWTDEKKWYVSIDNPEWPDAEHAVVCDELEERLLDAFLLAWVSAANVEGWTA